MSEKHLICSDGRCRARTCDLLLVRDSRGTQEPRAEGAEPGAAGVGDLAGESRGGCFAGPCVTGVSGPLTLARGGDEGESPRSFAVMEDDSVLCADCVHEAVGDGSSQSAGLMVRAWIDPGPGVCCGWCGESAYGGRWSA